MTAGNGDRFLPERAPEVGELVQVRSRRWLVEEVIPPAVPGQSCLARMACADDDAQGQSLDVYRDYEPDRRILGNHRNGLSSLAPSLLLGDGEQVLGTADDQQIAR